jgi:DNA topoisomerase-3
MDALVKELTGKELVITRVDKKKKIKSAPALYDLTELQRDGNKAFGFSAKETLSIMQRLYENHKVLTYPRTDSRYLTSDILGTLKERIQACGVGSYRQMAGALKGRQWTAKASFVNDAKVSDHHAIIPTEQFVDYGSMSNEERKIYDLVVRRFFAVLYPPCVYEETTITGTVGKEIFVTKGNVILEEGYQAVYHQEDEDELETGGGRLPVVKPQERLKPIQLVVKEDQTKPPARFNEATLLSAMENPSAFLEEQDKRMATTLGETGGLGTVATRADIIEKLFNSFLMEKRGKDIFLTSKGKQLLELVPTDLRKPEMTADWEMKLGAIAKGTLKSQSFMKEIRQYAIDLLNQIRAEQGTFRHDNMTNKKCPQCGLRLLAVNGKNAKLLVCQDRECGYRETLSRVSNARCPVCHKKMEMIEKGDEPTFVCGCGFKERLSKFQERRKKEGKGVSKRDVSDYMKKQKKILNQYTY